MQKLGVIVNPNARKNRDAFDRAAKLREIVGAHGVVVETDTPEDVAPALADMSRRGVQYFVADGGDGALHVLINGLRALHPNGPLPTVTPTNGGTIDFVARKVGVRASVEATVAALTKRIASGVAPSVVSIDSLQIDGVRALPNGSTETFSRIGFALAAGGIGQRFFDQYYASPTPGPRAIVGIVARAVGGYFAERLPFGGVADLRDDARAIFRPTEARVTIDGTVLAERKHGAIHAGAFEVDLGGVFRVFPLARPDGVLHFQAGSLSPVDMMKNLHNVASGRLLAARDFKEHAGRTMTLEALGEELLDPVIDGERFYGLRSMTITVGPRIDVARPGK
jgi:diacylglycerol kinase family enzyme